MFVSEFSNYLIHFHSKSKVVHQLNFKQNQECFLIEKDELKAILTLLVGVDCASYVLIFSCGQNPNPSSDTQNANAFIGKENCKEKLEK